MELGEPWGRGSQFSSVILLHSLAIHIWLPAGDQVTILSRSSVWPHMAHYCWANKQPNYVVLIQNHVKAIPVQHQLLKETVILGYISEFLKRSSDCSSYLFIPHGIKKKN